MSDTCTLDDNDDFQDTPVLTTRKQTRLQFPSAYELSTKCSICSNFWTNSGQHRIISIKCGHVFGEKCIIDMIKASGGETACPLCGKAIKKSHIRTIWPTKVFQQDETVLNDLKKRLAAAQTTLRDTNERIDVVSREYQQCRHTLNELSGKLQNRFSTRSKHLQQEERSQQASLSQQAATVNNNPFQLADTKLLSTDRNVTRVMTIVPGDNMVVATMKQDANSYGLYKLSLRDLNSSEYIANHAGLVRDVKNSKEIIDNGSATLLSTGLDKTLKLTSASNNCNLLSYTLPAAAWSCEFDAKNSNQFYCGLSDNHVLVFDIRNTKVPLQQMHDTNTLNIPLHAMISHRFDSTPTLFCANLTQVYQWRWPQEEPVCELFKMQENTYQPYALSLDEIENTLMVSSRASGSSSSKHTVFGQFNKPDNSGSNGDDVSECDSEWNIVWEHTIPRYRKTMARTDIYDGVACFSDDDGTIQVRQKDGPIQVIQADQQKQILDTKLLRIQHRQLLIALADNQLKLYKQYG